MSVTFKHTYIYTNVIRNKATKLIYEFLKLASQSFHLNSAINYL